VIVDHRVVEQLEDKIERSVALICQSMGKGELPLLPSPRTMHLMAKAAVAVYEAAVENQQSRGQ
jgi:hypothetical protein